MSNETARLLGGLDGPGQGYPPFEKMVPYPKFLVVNIYTGYQLISGQMICITQDDQMPLAQQLQAALAKIGFQWDIKLHQPEEGRKKVGVQFEIKPLQRGAGAYDMEIEISTPYSDGDGIISLAAHDLAGLERGVDALIQIIHLAFEEFGEDIVSMWVEDWVEAE
jgi:hypothetical protein